MAAKNKYREAHPEWFDDKGRVQPWVLRALINYDPETGVMTWKERGPEWFIGYQNTSASFLPAASIARGWNRENSGKIIGAVNHNNIPVSIFGIRYLCARIAYAITRDCWSEHPVTTTEKNRKKFAKNNIRLVSDIIADEIRDAAFFRDRGKTSSYIGVSFQKSKSRWRARISVNSKSIDLGRFKTEEEAADAYDAAALKYFGPSAYLNMAVHPEPAPEPAPEAVDPSLTEADDF